MKIYLVGSHCTGKTTLAKYIKDRYGIDMVSEVVRDIANDMDGDLAKIRADMDRVNDLQEKIFKKQHQREKEVGDDFVSDRGFDFLAYTAEYSTLTSDIRQMQEYHDYIRWMKKDSVVFFIRPSKTLLDGADDGFRERISWESICRIDGMIKFILELEDFDYIQIKTDIFQERSRLVESVVEGMFDV